MITSYAVDSIAVVKWNGEDQWGEPIATTSVAAKGYIEWKTGLIRNIKGEEVVSTVRVYIPLRKLDKSVGRALRHEDRIVVDGMERAIIAIHEPKAFNLPHYEVYLA